MSEQSILKKTVLAGLGVYSMSKERAQEFMQELVKRGELSKDEGPKFVKAMMEKADEEVAFLKKLIDQRIDAALERVRPSHEDELQKINRKLDKLTKEIEKLNK